MRVFDPVLLLLICIAVFAGVTEAGLGIAPGLVAALSRSADVDTTLTAMWSLGEAIASLRNRPRPLCVRRAPDRTICLRAILSGEVTWLF
jgi:hypothetical protein